MTYQTLRECRPRAYKNYDGDVGIEIETETANSYDSPSLNYWLTQPDGSLRNFGIEYVLRKPLKYGSNEYYSAMEEFAEWVKANASSKWLNSTYSSVHVHFNMTNKTPRFITNFMTLYVLFENVLTRYCGPDRDGNLFCLKTKNAEASLLLYQQFFRDIARGKKYFINNICSLNENNNKYSAMNICPLKTLGSIEIRTHGGTTSTEEIDNWVSILHTLYSSAAAFDNPKDIFDTLHTDGALVFFEKVFGEYSHFLLTKDTIEDIETTYFYAKTLLYSVYSPENWSTFGLYDDIPLYKLIKIPSKYWEEEGLFFSSESVSTTYTTVLDQ